MSKIFWVTILSLSNVLLCLSFIIHLISKFRYSPNRFFVFSWLVFWIAMTISYTFKLFSEVYFPNSKIYSVGNNLINIILALSLAVTSDYFVDSQELNFKKSAKWLLFLLVLIPMMFNDTFKIASFSVSYINYISIAVFAGRYLNALHKKSELSVIFLYLYASVPIIFPLIVVNRLENFTYSFILTCIVLPLKIILYSTGYIYLNTTSYNAENRTTHIDRIDSSNCNEKKEIPDPNVEISLSGIWGFLYIMWKYPSGKFVVLVLVISLFLAFTFVIINISTFSSIFSFWNQKR